MSGAAWRANGHSCTGLVTRRFGPGTTEQLVPVLDGIADPELIAGVADAVVECRTAAEFIGRAKAVVGR